MPLVDLEPDPENAVVAGFLNGKDKISDPYYRTGQGYLSGPFQ